MNLLPLLLVGVFGLEPHCPDCARQDSTALPPVIVEESAAETRQRGPEAPTRINVLELRRYKPQLEFAELLAEVPGIFARERYNYAQDTQISVRGFGARSAFGVRGVRIEYDGIPATAADGQSQIGHIDVAAAGRVEVIRGPFAALYGNGGAFIRIDGSGPRQRISDRASIGAGSNGQTRVAVALDGGERLRWDISANHFRTDGERANSAARRTLLSARAEVDVGESGLLSLSANSQDQPDSEDPQGLTRAEFINNPGAANPAAQLFGTIKSVNQEQVGARYRHDFGDSQVQVSAYAGQRQIDQVLSVPRSAQISPTNGGGIVDLGRDYNGAALRFSHPTDWGFAQAELSGELRVERLTEDRRGYENFRGPMLGVRGALRRDERNDAQVRDGMLRLDLDPSEDWRLSAGVRRNRTRYRSDDYYVAPGNPDDSGRYQAAAWLPVIGARYSATERISLHAAAGRTHEVPTLGELAYRADGEGGFNSALRPARAKQWELSARYADERLHLDASVFRVDGESEIVVDTSEGGRTSFQNAAATRRSGVELAGDYRLSEAWRLRAVVSFIEARYTQSYATCTRQPCPSPDFVIEAGRRLPGVAPRQALLELLWRGAAGWNGALDWRALDATAASDRNDDQVPGYATLNLRLNRQFDVSEVLQLSAQLRIDNLTDHQYSASLIVNEGARRYYEPAPGRNYFAGVELRW